MPQTLDATAGQLVDVGDARGAASGIAVGASLLLHLGIVGLIFFKQSDTQLSEAPLSKVAMVVSVTSTNPQLKLPSPAAPAGIDAANPLLEIPSDQPVEETEPADAPAVEQTANLDQSPALPAIAPVPELPGNQSVGNPGAPGISTEQVNNSVSTYIANYKSALTDDWLSACLQYQNEHGVKTCPPGEEGKSENTKTVHAATAQLFTAYVSGGAANARASKQLLEEMDAVRPFMNDTSVMGDLARQRYELAKTNYCQLNPCRGAATTTSGSFATPISNEGRITIMVFGSGGGPNIVAGLMNLMVKPKASAAKPFVPYRFTATPEEQAESEDEFEVEAPVFPIRR